MAVWVYDDELVWVDRHQDVLYRLLRRLHPVPHGWAHAVEPLSLRTEFGRVPRANWTRRPLHAQSYNFPTQFPTRHAATSAHQTGRAHTQSLVSGGLVGRCSDRTMGTQPTCAPPFIPPKGRFSNSKGHLRNQTNDPTTTQHATRQNFTSKISPRQFSISEIRPTAAILASQVKSTPTDVIDDYSRSPHCPLIAAVQHTDVTDPGKCLPQSTTLSDPILCNTPQHPCSMQTLKYRDAPETPNSGLPTGKKGCIQTGIYSMYCSCAKSI